VVTRLVPTLVQPAMQLVLPMQVLQTQAPAMLVQLLTLRPLVLPIWVLTWAPLATLVLISAVTPELLVAMQAVIWVATLAQAPVVMTWVLVMPVPTALAMVLTKST
jgi:hypothetical protein